MGLEDDIRRLVIQSEDTLPDGGRRAAFKEALVPQYRLLLNALSRPQPTSITRVDDYLRVVRAMREPERLAELTGAPESGAPGLERLLTSPLRVLAAYLARLSRTTLLVVETGADMLTLCAVCGGSEPLSERIALEHGSKELVAAVAALGARHRKDVERIARAKALDTALLEGIKAEGEALWKTLPSGIRACLERADTILYSFSAFGQLSEIPIELCWTGRGWLGTTRVVARFPSLRTLVETLSPNRMPSHLDPSALIVLATEDKELPFAKNEISGVSKALRQMGLTCDPTRRPRLLEVKKAFDEGLRAMHFVGHGIANPLGEALPIGKETLRPEDFSELGGARTPFAFLNACEVGRARTGAGGGPAGFSTRLIEKGAPAVVACLQPVPDRVATDIAVAFYEAAATRTAGEALTQARGKMAAVPYPASCWGAYVLFGDPALSLRGKGSNVHQTREQTRDWPAHLSRFLTLRSEDERSAALDLLALEARQVAPDLAAELKTASTWVRDAFRNGPAKDPQRLALCDRLAKSDVVAGASLRMLLAMERLERLRARDRSRGLAEAEVGLRAAAAILDTMAWPAFAGWIADSASSDLDPIGRKRLLTEAEGMLAGWALTEPGVEPLLESVRSRR